MTPFSREIANSNSTVRRFLGGRQRQLSWMLGAGSSAPSRPLQSPKPLPQQSQPLPPAPAPVPAPAQAPVSTTPAPAVLPSPAPSDEPSPAALSGRQDSPIAPLTSTTDVDPTASPPLPQPHITTDAHFIVDLTADEAMPPTEPPTPTLPSQHEHSLEMTISDNRAGQQRAAKRRRIEFSTKFLLEPLNARWNAIPQPNPLDKERFRLLKEACDEGDVFYIVLHQIFCLWTFKDGLDIQALKLNQAELSYGILISYLRDNKALSLPVLRLFTTFPGMEGHDVPEGTGLPLDWLESQYDPISRFLNRLAAKDPRTYARSWYSRGFPLLVDEMIGDLLLPSLVLQRVMFRVSRRTATRHALDRDTPTAILMDQELIGDQQRHLDEKCNWIPVPPLDAQTLKSRNSALIQRYRELVIQERMQASTSGRSPPVSASRDPSHSPIVAQRQLPSHQQQQHMYLQAGSQADAQHQQARLQGIVRQQQIQRRLSQGLPFANSMLSSVPTPITNDPIVGSPPVFHSPQFSGSPISQSPGQVQSSHILMSNSPSTINPQLGYFPTQGNAQIIVHYGQVHNTHQQTRPHAGSQPPPGQSLINNIPPLRPPGPTHMMPSGHSTPGLHQFPSALIQPLQQQQQLHRQPSQVRQQFQSPNILTQDQFRLQPLQRVPNPISGSASPYQQPTIPRKAPVRLIPHHDAPAILPAQYPHDPYDRRARTNALHQAHLRSPDRAPRIQDKKGNLISPVRYYQAVRDFAAPPICIKQHYGLQSMFFNIEDEQFDKIDEPTIPQGGLPIYLFENQSLRYRFKMIERRVSESELTLSDWVVTDTRWPKALFLKLNGHTLEIRRKQHHGKDLPIELDRSMLNHGRNDIVISVPMHGQRPLPEGWAYYLAVEVIEVLNHHAVLDFVRKNGFITAAQSKLAIQKRISGVRTEDDDIALVNSDLSVDVADPFSASIWKTPVRGKKCTHLECFDLDTWLETRQGKPRDCAHGPGCACPKGPEPSFVDKWKCPTCNQDARPYNLVIDGFLLEVRRQLEMENKLYVKSIWVSADGTWTPRSGEPDTKDEEDETAISIKKVPTAPQPPVEVIDLSDGEQ